MLGVWVGKDRLLSRVRHLSDVLTCTVPPLRVESSLLKNWHFLHSLEYMYLPAAPRRPDAKAVGPTAPHAGPTQACH
jgi:hypothetical protein